jgi:microcystin-dependent protein
MAKQLFANNASALLAASISDSDLTIQVDSGYGVLFPNPGEDEFFAVSLENADGDIEIVYCSARSTDLLTVSARGQEGTTAQAWTNGQTRVELRLTKGTMDGFLQRSGGEMTGDIDMNDNEIQAARLTGDWVGAGGQLVGTVLRGTEDDASNEIEVPAGGGRATAGGAALLTENDDLSEVVFAVGMIMLWYGAAINVPTGWAICNGANDTPDLRDRFVVGAGDSYALDATGGATSANTDSQGAHDHTTTTGAHTLTVDEIPAHTHSMQSQLFVDEIDNGTGKTYVVQGTGMVTGSAGGGQPHTHPGGTTSSAGGHTHSVATLPPYRALYYIMFVGS